MLKRIGTAQVRLGMYIHALDGAWLDHPFWKSNFTLSDPEDLIKLRNSQVQHVWIDVSQGMDVITAPCPAQPDMTAAAQATPPIAAPSPPTPSLPPSAPAAVSMHEELRRATQVCERGRQQVVSMFTEARLGGSLNAQACLPLVQEISESVLRNPGALVSLARLKTKDDYTYMHSVAVCALMVSLGREIGLDESACRQAGLAGLLHDLGKALVPLELLNKPGRLTPEEFAVIKTHPRLGHEMLAEGQAVPTGVMDACLHHHERVDGAGYPDRLDAGSLSLLARMCAICDVYDAITSNRPYKAGWDPGESVAQMASWKGHFDPVLFQSFVKALGVYPTGSLVRLASGYLAVVIEQNSQSLTTPVVRTFYSLNTQMPTTPARLELIRSNDRIVGRENPKKWGFKHLDSLWLGDVQR